MFEPDWVRLDEANQELSRTYREKKQLKAERDQAVALAAKYREMLERFDGVDPDASIQERTEDALAVQRLLAQDPGPALAELTALRKVAEAAEPIMAGLPEVSYSYEAEEWERCRQALADWKAVRG